MTELEHTFGGNKFVGKIEFFRNFLSKRIHSEGLCGVVSAGVEVKLKFLGEVEVMLF